MTEHREKPLVSVVIPTYNRPEQLIRACDAVFRQTYEPIEVVVVNDNSDADYSGVVAELGSKITYVERTVNGGGSAARNTGIEAAKGEYVAFLDDDDIWNTDKLMKQIASLDGIHSASHCGYELRSTGKIRIEEKAIISGEDLRENNKLASTSGLLAKRELLLKHRFDETLKRSQDWDLYIRLSSDTDFSYVQSAEYVYDDGDHSRMSNKLAELDKKSLLFRTKIFDKNSKFFGRKFVLKHKAEYLLRAFSKSKDKKSLFMLCVDQVGWYYSIKTLFLLAANKKIKQYINRG